MNIQKVKIKKIRCHEENLPLSFVHSIQHNVSSKLFQTGSFFFFSFFYMEMICQKFGHLLCYLETAQKLHQSCT